jgi:replicative DNA helicase
MNEQDVPIAEASEGAIIGCVLKEPVRAMGVIAEAGVTEGMFFQPKAKSVWKALSKMAPDTIDVLTAHEECRQAKLDVSLSDIDAYYDSGNAMMATLRWHIDQLRDAYIRRWLMKLSGEIRAKAIDVTSFGADTLSNLITISVKAQGALGSSGVRKPDEVIKQIMANIDALRNGAVPEGVTSMIPSLNTLLGGYKGICVVAARPGMGKSTFLGNELAFCASRGVKASLASLEMTEEQFRLRVLCERAEVPSFNAQIGRITNGHWDSLCSWADQQGKWPLRVSENSFTIDQLCGWMSAEVQVHGTQVIGIDYLQIIMSCGNRRDSRAQEVANWMNALRDTQKRLKVPVLLVSQIGREYEKEGRRPRLSDLKDSGAVEQDATQVVFLHDTEGGYLGIVAKNRFGATGDVMLNFRKEINRFSEMARSSDVRQAPEWAP